MIVSTYRWICRLSFHLVDSFCLKLSSTPASKTNVSASPDESHVELEGASTCKEPTIQTDLQARKNHDIFNFSQIVLVCHNVICTYWSQISCGLAAQSFPLFRWWTKYSEWQVWSKFVYIFSPVLPSLLTTTIGLSVKRTMTDELWCQNTNHNYKDMLYILWSSYYALDVWPMYYSVLNVYL